MTGRVAFVTGAASGIGRAIALRLAADGADVVVNDLTLQRASVVREEIATSGGRAIAVAGNVAIEAEVTAMVDEARCVLGDIDLLVNNAGHVHQARFVDIEPAEFDRMFAVHVRGNYLMTRAVLPAMLAAKAGVIVNVASQLGQIGGVELAHYCAAKAAIIGMTKALAREVSALGVRVNAVAPGPINTALGDGHLRGLATRQKAKELPLGRFGQPEEVAAAVAFLAPRPAAGLFVGQTICPNSGDVML